MHQIISIEGNIGSGKSTFLKYLRDKCSTNKHIVFVDEPVDEWSSITDDDGNDMISKFYDNQEKYAFSFQMMAYIARLTKLRKAIAENPHSIIVTERSLYTDKHVFAKMLYDEKKIETVNYKIYLSWFHEFIKDLPKTTFLYIKTQPSVCHERVKKRDRKGEDNISLQYLSMCSEYHNKMMNFMTDEKLKVHTIDGNCNLEENSDLMEFVDLFSKNTGFTQTQIVNNMLHV